MCAKQNEEGCATVTWEIRNFALLLEEWKGLRSPLWKMEHTEGSAEWWRLCALPSPSDIRFYFIPQKEYMAGRKQRFSLVSSGGEVPLENGHLGFFFIEKAALLGQNRQSMLPNNTLTLRCRMWNNTIQNSEVSINSDLHGVNYLWNIEHSDTERELSYNKFIEQGSFLLYFYLKKKSINNVTHVVTIGGQCEENFFSFVDCKMMSVKDGGGHVTNKAWLYDKMLCDVKIRTENNTNVCVELKPIVALHKVCNTTELAKSNVKNNDFLILFKEKLFCDATLTADGQSFPAHRGVLAARSPVFRVMFERRETSEGRSGVVAIDDVDGATLERMLVFLYGGLLGEVGWEEALALYYVADKYDVRPLKQKCVDILKNSLSVSNACDLLVLADAHSDLELKKCVVSFIQEHQEVVSSKKWEELEDKNSQLTSKTLREFFLSSKRKK